MPREASSGVEDTFQISTWPSSSSNRQMSVNVPPESTPTRQRAIAPPSIRQPTSAAIRSSRGGACDHKTAYRCEPENIEMTNHKSQAQSVDKNLKQAPFWWEAAPLEPDLGIPPPV